MKDFKRIEDQVDARRRFNVYKTSMRCRQHRIDVL